MSKYDPCKSLIVLYIYRAKLEHFTRALLLIFTHLFRAYTSSNAVKMMSLKALRLSPFSEDEDDGNWLSS